VCVCMRAKGEGGVLSEVQVVWQKYFCDLQVTSPVSIVHSSLPLRTHTIFNAKPQN